MPLSGLASWALASVSTSMLMNDSCWLLHTPHAMRKFHTILGTELCTAGMPHHAISKTYLSNAWGGHGFKQNYC